MPRYNVESASRETGDIQTITVEAPDEAEASRIVMDRGLMAGKVTLIPTAAAIPPKPLPAPRLQKESISPSLLGGVFMVVAFVWFVCIALFEHERRQDVISGPYKSLPTIDWIASYGLFYLQATLLMLTGLIIAALGRGAGKKCPDCCEWIPKRARVCSHCRREF